MKAFLYNSWDFLRELAVAAFVATTLIALLATVAAPPSSPLSWPEYYLLGLYLVVFGVAAWNGRTRPQPPLDSKKPKE